MGIPWSIVETSPVGPSNRDAQERSGRSGRCRRSGEIRVRRSQAPPDERSKLAHEISQTQTTVGSKRRSGNDQIGDAGCFRKGLGARICAPRPGGPCAYSDHIAHCARHHSQRFFVTERVVPDSRKLRPRLQSGTHSKSDLSSLRSRPPRFHHVCLLSGAVLLPPV